ncbi:DUF4097 family beta strand repeat-containing protein [Cyclobacterium qasimii]|uniref:DUF4097 domain-containing protein n=2 Tax=Cyclobacterium qasimii TaxID=1350429 RepID=S7VD68_9BACT|nr:DUF4097 family beta strand repeat-containing protein [Cyclobacterium qasimii]EPR67512.1 hypothetical protein ADICYQ_3536 [Cyclobacterium qasimii M12-11B]GEO21748.1 hypothetical protein CQA01_22820 [Cyclobacterium qasimii]
MKSYTKYYYLLITLLFVGIESSKGQEIINKSFSGIQKLEIKSGSIEIQYEGKEDAVQLDLEAFLGQEENADKNLVMITVGNTLKIAYNGSNEHRGNKRYIKLNGPASMQLSVKSSSGSVVISGVDGPSHQIEASSGQVKIFNVKGDLLLKASSGNIQLAHLRGNVDCKISSGNASIEDVKGNVNFKATSGQLKANAISGLLNAKLTSGNMKLNQIGELGRLEITSGNIRADHAGLGTTTSMDGSSGNIQITTTSDINDYNFEMRAGSGNIKVGNRSGNKAIHIQNGKSTTISGKVGSGNISIQQL